MPLQHLVIAPIALPLLAATLCLAAPRASRAISLCSALATLAVSVFLVATAASGDALVYLLGNWRAPFGIALLSDRLGAWAVLATAWVLCGVLLFSIGAGRDKGAYFHPLYQVLWMGVNGAFLTADVFNLFVFFEVMLVGSYGIALQGAGMAEARATLRYVAINLAGSALFLIAAGLLYGVCGTLSMADLALRLPALQGADRALALSGAGLLAVVFLLKAAALPLSAWLPQTYGGVSPASAASFTLLTKLGAYGMLRVVSLWGGTLFDANWIAVVMACGAGTVLLAGAGALASLSLARVAAWGVLGSSGLLLIVFCSGSPQALAGGLFYLPPSAMCASALFLVADLHRRNRLADGKLWLLIAAVGVAGLPPLAPFLAKLQALDGLFAAPDLHGLAWLILAASLLTLTGLARVALRLAGAGGEPANKVEHLALAWLCGGALAMSTLAAPIQRYTAVAASELAAPQAYIRQVLDAVPVGGR
ncbi:proton-conducting transporter membrane subunit [Niveibacterium umoris]|uniref:Multicomponent K+:H+ antiporter subunit D n=1 Tax=Niveibacterium umoris TaxID=1193620 RepID=A0A840BPI8_9RHOO|nr:proton-conducting transporter membrane subunit [Niveibacterium umoris]MBB4012347.1 multicomponent K+:H+ antiporter subunit D [Niveibacterium umoris]